MSTERVLAPADAKGNWITEDSEDYYIPTDTSWQGKSLADPATQMYQRARESCWTYEKE